MLHDSLGKKIKEAIERVMVNLTGYLLLLLMIYVDNGNMAARALPLEAD